MANFFEVTKRININLMGMATSSDFVPANNGKVKVGKIYVGINPKNQSQLMIYGVGFDDYCFGLDEVSSINLVSTNASMPSEKGGAITGCSKYMFVFKDGKKASITILPDKIDRLENIFIDMISSGSASSGSVISSAPVAAPSVAPTIARVESNSTSTEEKIKLVQLLKNIKELLDLGAITEEEYNRQKEDILKQLSGETNNSPRPNEKGEDSNSNLETKNDIELTNESNVELSTEESILNDVSNDNCEPSNEEKEMLESDDSHHNNEHKTYNNDLETTDSVVVVETQPKHKKNDRVEPNDNRFVAFIFAIFMLLISIGAFFVCGFWTGQIPVKYVFDGHILIVEYVKMWVVPSLSIFLIAVSLLICVCLALSIANLSKKSQNKIIDYSMPISNVSLFICSSALLIILLCKGILYPVDYFEWSIGEYVNALDSRISSDFSNRNIWLNINSMIVFIGTIIITALSGISAFLMIRRHLLKKSNHN